MFNLHTVYGYSHCYSQKCFIVSSLGDERDVWSIYWTCVCCFSCLRYDTVLVACVKVFSCTICVHTVCLYTNVVKSRVKWKFWRISTCYWQI